MTEERIKAFEDLKLAVANSMELHSPDWRLPFRLYSDASSKAMGNILTQIDPRDNMEYPISLQSRAFTKTEAHKCTFEKEAISLHQGLQYNRQTILGAKIEAFVDARALLFLRLMNTSSQYVRMAIAISEFDITIQHVAGPDNVVADALSRLHGDEKEAKKYFHHLRVVHCS